MAKQPKFKHTVLPMSMFKFAWLDKPQDPYEGNGDPEYKLRCLFDDTPENRAALQAVLDLAYAEAKTYGIKLKKQHRIPFQYPEDQDEDDYVPAEGKDKARLDEDHQGRIFLNLKAKFKPAQIDAALNNLPEDTKIMGGDKGKVKVQVVPYDGLGSGVSLRMKVVQLIEKNTSFGKVNLDGMEAEEGYVADIDEDDDDEDDKF